MKNTITLVFVFAVFAIVGAGTALYLQLQGAENADGTGDAQKTSGLDAMQPPKATFENGSVVNHVFLLQAGALPDAMAVKLGEFVQFDEKDGKFHSIAQGGGDEFNQTHSHEEFGLESGKFGPGEAYRISFSRTGTFHFHDHYNSKIFVTVIVYREIGNSSNLTG